MGRQMPREDPTIVIDTREPAGGGWEPYFSVPTVRGKLDTGDYSIVGAEHLVAIERKSLPDLLSSLTHERTRFERELQRSTSLDFFAVIIEASAADVLSGKFGRFARSVNANAVWESIAAFSVRYCPFLFASDQRTAARMCESMLRRWVRDRRAKIEPEKTMIPTVILGARIAATEIRAAYNELT